MLHTTATTIEMVLYHYILGGVPATVSSPAALASASATRRVARVRLSFVADVAELLRDARPSGVLGRGTVDRAAASIVVLFRFV